MVFFKRIRSKTKFWQALGRGTRRRPGLECVDGTGAYRGKRYFYVFDYMENFEFFRANKNGVKGSAARSLNEIVFGRKVRLIAALQDSAFQEDEDCRKWRAEMVAESVAQVAAINGDAMAARPERALLDKYRDENSFAALSGSDVEELTRRVAPLAIVDEPDEFAKRFDAILYGAALAALEGKRIDESRRRTTEICVALEGKGSIPQVASNLATIRFAKSDEFWNAAPGEPFALETVRRELRALCQFLSDESDFDVVFSSFDDETTARREDVEFNVPSTNCDEYRNRVEEYIRAHKDDPEIDKLRNNVPLTKSEWARLQQIFESLGSEESLRKAIAGKTLGIFVRQIAKMDRAGVERAFCRFVDVARLNEAQYAFARRVIDHVEKNGYIEISDLKGPKFARPSAFDLFKPDHLKRLKDFADDVKRNAEPDVGAEITPSA